MIVGQPGAGKTTAGQILLRQNCNCIVVEAGDVIRERYIQEARPGEATLSFVERLFRTEGYDLNVTIIVRRLFDELSNAPAKTAAVVVGLRTPEQIKKVSEHFAEAHTLAVHTSPRLRFARIKRRNRADDPRSFDEFIREDFRELSWGLGRVLYESPNYLFNERSIRDFATRLLPLYSVLGGA